MALQALLAFFTSEQTHSRHDSKKSYNGLLNIKRKEKRLSGIVTESKNTMKKLQTLSDMCRDLQTTKYP